MIEKIHQAPLTRLKQELEVVKAQKELAAAREAGATPLELIKEEAELLKATRELADVRGSLETDPLEHFKKETELADAHAVYQAAMKALESDSTAARHAQTAGLQADAVVALAEKAKLEVDIGLAEVRTKQKWLPRRSAVPMAGRGLQAVGLLSVGAAGWRRPFSAMLSRVRASQ